MGFKPFKKIEAFRCAVNPLITFDSHPNLGQNVNGPSVISVPDWVEDPLGKYYMYFAHHSGRNIRLAYADDLPGPWHIYEKGTLQLEDAKAFEKHIASPDVHIDHKNKKIKMYFHGNVKGRAEQWSGISCSNDGLSFQASDQILGKFYFRVFEYKDYFYAIAKDWNNGSGELYRSKDGLSSFESAGAFISNIRHSAVRLVGDELQIFYTKVGDLPERVLCSSVDLSKDWKEWKVSKTLEVLRPKEAYEGIAYEKLASKSGAAIEVQELRDPCIYEEDGKLYLFYSYAGEMGIAMAELKIR